MRTIYNVLLVAILLFPATGFTHEKEYYDDDHYEEWYPHREDDRSSRHWSTRREDGEERYYYSDGDRHDDSRRDDQRRKKLAPAGWDINPDIAKRAPNCHHYRLNVKGGKATARITPLPGKNYVQTHGERVGYVCFGDSARLELGKLANPETEVTLRLRDIGTFVFSRGDKGSQYKKSWYRSYWNLR